MAPVAALGKKTEALRNYSPGDAHARAHPELCGSSRTWIWVNLPFFSVSGESAAEEVPVANGERVSDGGGLRFGKTQSRKPCCGCAAAGTRTGGGGQQLGATLAWPDPPQKSATGSAFRYRRAKNEARLYFLLNDASSDASKERESSPE